MRSIKKSLTMFLAFLALVAFSIGIVGAFTPNVRAEIVDVPQGSNQTQLTEKIDSLESFEVIGTAVRTVAPWGMRFITVISDADLALLPENAEFGTLIIPTDKLEGELDLDNELAAKAKAKVGYDGAEVPAGYKGYTGVIVGDTTSTAFPEKDYDRDFTAVGYVTYTYGDGQVDTIYTVEKNNSLVEIADAALNDPDSDLAGDEDLSSIVNSVMSNVTIELESYALKTGERINTIINGQPETPIALEIVPNDYVGFDFMTGEVYGKKVGTGALTFKVASTGATMTTDEITVSAIEAGKVDRVEFLTDDNAIDFSAVVTSTPVIADALSADSVTLSAGTVSSIADNKIVLAKPASDHDALYGGDKAMTLTAVKGDIEYTINFTTDIADYIVDTKAELDNVNTITNLSATSWAGYVMLGADINYEYGTFAGIAPLQTATHPNDVENLHVQTGFKGVFDGNGHYIDNMTIGNAESRNVGFFGSLAYNAVVKNVAFLDVILLYSTANDYQAAGVIAAISFASTITDVLVVAEVKDICGKTWSSNEGHAWSGKLGIALGHKSNPSTFTNCVFINNVNSLREKAWPGADNNIYSTKTASYDNVLGIFFATSGKPTGMTSGHHSAYLHDHSTQGLLKDKLDVSKMNQDVWGMQKADLQMGSYELIGNIIFFNGNALKAVDTWYLSYPPIVNK